MDPIGFALENYDAAGAWRPREDQFVASLPEKEFFEAPVEPGARVAAQWRTADMHPLDAAPA